MKYIEAGKKIIIECIETNIDKHYCCDMCFFYHMLPHCPYMCSAAIRKDGKNVIFKEIK